jgi:hypothetical protein
MLPSNENIVYHMAEQLAANLMNNNVGHAYPQLVPVLQTMGFDLRNVFSQLLGAQRQELFFGEAPWAKLYELQTGRTICVPDRTILKNLCPERGSMVGDRPWEEILKYFLAGWENPEGDEEWHFFLGGPTDYDNQVVINFKNMCATYYWANNDMCLTLPVFSHSRGQLTCPLFHEPYDVDVEYPYIQRTLLDQLMAGMLTIWDKANLDPVDSDLLVHQCYYGIDGKEVKDEDNVKQLAVLFNGNMYSKYGKAYGYVDWNGYRLQFSTKRDWNSDPSIVLKVAVMHPIDDKNPHDRSVYNWHKNPLLVADLRADMDTILDQLITQHELSMKEQ